MQGTPEAKPRVEYDQSIDWSNQEFDVNVDVDRCGALFSFLGMSDDAIRRKTIFISSITPPNPNPEELLIIGYDREKDTIVLFPMNLWNNYIEDVTVIIGFAGAQYTEQTTGLSITKESRKPVEDKVREVLEGSEGIEDLLNIARFSPDDFIRSTQRHLVNRNNYFLNHYFILHAQLAADLDPQGLDYDPRWESLISLNPYPLEVSIVAEINHPDAQLPNTQPLDHMPSAN